jgi:HEAT repeat protein
MTHLNKLILKSSGGNILFDSNKLKELITNSQIDDAIVLIEEIGENKNEEAFQFLINILRKTDNHALRNAVALTLNDLGNQEAVEPIVEMLKNPKTMGNRGTLLYSLKSFDYSAHIDLLVDFIINGNYEVRHEAKELIQELKSHLTDETLLRTIVRIKKELDEVEDRGDVLSESLDALCNLKKSLKG